MKYPSELTEVLSVYTVLSSFTSNSISISFGIASLVYIAIPPLDCLDYLFAAWLCDVLCCVLICVGAFTLSPLTDHDVALIWWGVDEEDSWCKHSNTETIVDVADALKTALCRGATTRSCRISIIVLPRIEQP